MARRANRQQYRKTSSRIKQADIGTHVVRMSDKASKMNVKFSNKHRAARADRGEIDHVLPGTSSRESASAYNQRVNRKGFAAKTVRKSRAKGLFVGLAVAVVAIIVALAVGWFSFTSGVSGKMALADNDTKAALTAPANAQDPFYMLVQAEYSDKTQPYAGPDLLMLARVDAENKTVTLVSIPSTVQVTLSDGRFASIAEEQLIGGDAGMIEAVNDFADVSIAHFMKVDAAGFVKLVDDLGGVTVAVPQEVDDPEAGDLYIKAGTQTLDGASAMVLCRADNYPDPTATRASNQEAVIIALVEKVLAKEGFDRMALLDQIASYFKTDMDYSRMMDLIQTFSSVSDDTVYATRVPGSAGTDDDGPYFAVSTTAWTNTMAAVDEGRDPNEKSVQTGFDPAEVSVEVKNGAGITNGAAQMVGSLAALGYTKAENGGNTESQVYTETLFIYEDDAYKVVAESMADGLDCGRAISAGIYYDFDVDVQVIVGSDWKPIA